MKQSLQELMTRFRELGIDQQIDYDKFYLYSIITHSTAFAGSTMTEEEVSSLFDGIPATSKSNQKSNQKVVDAI